MPQLSRSLSLTVEDGSGLSVCGEDSFEIVNAKRLVPIRGRVNSGHNKNKKTNKASIMSTTYPGPPGRKSNSHEMSTPSPATRTTRLFYTKDRVIDAGITSVQPASWSEKTLPSPHQPQHHRHHRHHHENDSKQGNGNQLSVEVEQAKTNELIVEQDSPKPWRHQKHLSVNQQEPVEHSESTEEQHSQQQTVQVGHDRPWQTSTDVSPLALEAINASIAGAPFADVSLYVANEHRSIFANSAILTKACPAIMKEIEQTGELNLDTMEASTSGDHNPTVHSHSSPKVSPLALEPIFAPVDSGEGSMDPFQHAKFAEPKDIGVEPYEGLNSGGDRSEMFAFPTTTAGPKGKDADEASLYTKGGHTLGKLSRAFRLASQRSVSASKDSPNKVEEHSGPKTAKTPAHKQHGKPYPASLSFFNDATHGYSDSSVFATLPLSARKLSQSMQVSSSNVVPVLVHGCCSQTLRALIFYLYTAQVRFEVPWQKEGETAVTFELPPPTPDQPQAKASTSANDARPRGRKLGRTLSTPTRNMSTSPGKGIKSSPDAPPPPLINLAATPFFSSSPPPMSPHSAYCLASTLALDKLASLAFDHLVKTLHPRTALSEFLSPFALRFPPYQDMVLEFIKRRWQIIHTLDETKECLAKLAKGGFPQAQQALVRLFAELDISQSPSAAAAAAAAVAAAQGAQ